MEPVARPTLLVDCAGAAGSPHMGDGCRSPCGDGRAGPIQFWSSSRTPSEIPEVTRRCFFIEAEKEFDLFYMEWELNLQFSKSKFGKTGPNLYWYIKERLTQSRAAQQLLGNDGQVRVVFKGPRLQSDPGSVKPTTSGVDTELLSKGQLVKIWLWRFPAHFKGS